MEDAIKKRLNEKKSLDEIGRELCDNVDDRRGKVMRYIKKMPDYGDKFLIDNADWLGFDVSKINNPQGINRPKIFGQENVPENIPPLEKIMEWNEKLKNAIEPLKEIEFDMDNYNFNTERIHSINIKLQQYKKEVSKAVDNYETRIDKTSNEFTVKDLKQIIKLVSTNGLVDEFIIRKDGSVIATSTDGTMMVALNYKGINLPEDIGVYNVKKFLGAITRFSDETVVEFNEDQYILGTGTRTAIIPRLSIDAIRKSKPIPEIAYAVTIPNVPLNRLKRAVKNQTKEIEEHYTFAIEDGIFKILVGEKEVGSFTEDIVGVTTDKTLHSTFWVNVPQVVKTLKGNPTISMGDDKPLKVEVTTDKYSVSYMLAPKAYGEVFIWDDIPGKDNGKLIEFLKIRFSIDWIETAEIEKIDGGRTIRLSFKNNFLSLTLNDWKNRVNIKIDDGRTDEIVARTVNDKLYIYKEMSFQDKCDYVAVTYGMDN